MKNITGLAVRTSLYIYIFLNNILISLLNFSPVVVLQDDNRYNAGKGAHLTLKRAEKARSLVNKLPGMVEALASKTIAWEKERGVEFLYDGVSTFLLSKGHSHFWFLLFSELFPFTCHLSGSSTFYA